MSSQLANLKGKIEVHNPHKLESDILNKYFRHSKYASFQRQLNYFGFRKLAGKGKMAPCSYVNENATADLRSLLRMKRKTSATTKDGKGDKGGGTLSTNSDNGMNSNHKRNTSQQLRGVIVNPVINIDNKRSKGENGLKVPISKGGVKHALNGYLKSTPMSITSNNLSINNPLAIQATNTQLNGNDLDPLTLAQSAVGKGVQHQFLMDHAPASSKKSAESSSETFTFLEPSQLGMGIEKSLSELQNNFRNSMNEHGKSTDDLSKLKRVSSLVDLAMIPSLSMVEPTPVYQMTTTSENLMSFVDFPSGEFDPTSKQCNDGPTRLAG